MLSKLEILLVILTIYRPKFTLSYEREMTVHIEAGKKECFYDHVKSGDTIDVEYQVIDGGHGDLDISFTLSDPIGLIIVSDLKKPENIHTHDARKDGDYRFCLDNTFSTFNRKTVFFQLIVENPNGDNAPGDDSQLNDVLEGLTPEEYYEMKVQDIMDYIGRIRIMMTKARHYQDMLRSHESRDRYLLEANYMKVNAWSCFQLCMMIIVGLFQVYMVRSIFDTRMSNFWQKFGL